MANPSLIKSLVAEAAVNPYRIVKFGTADGKVLQGAAATDSLVGIADNLGQATVGNRVDVILTGVADVEFGGSVTRGGEVTADADGKAVAAAPAAGANNRIIGIAMVSASAGDIAPVLVCPGLKQG